LMDNPMISLIPPVPMGCRKSSSGYRSGCRWKEAHPLCEQ
jgi:hypothetical protein